MAERSRRWRLVLVLLGVVLLLAGGILLHRIADAVRGTPVREMVGRAGETLPPVSDTAFLEVAGALAEVDLEAGHRVEILNDGTVYTRLLEDIARARRSVTVLMYYCEPGNIGNRIAEALAERARAGVPVFFLADDFGCGELVADVGEDLALAGVRLASFRPVRWYTLHRAQHRNHARTVVIDGVIGYTGGFGIADKWTTRGSGDQLPWRDTNVRFTGPSVHVVQALFLASWAETTGALHTEPAFFPDAGAAPGEEAVDGAVAGFFSSEPELGTTVAERLLALSIAGAERTLFVANAYFVPTPILLQLLQVAARRGVDVRILVPGEETDIPTVLWAGRSLYPALLDAGVRIWEYQPTMMHAKTLVADGVWSMVGSLNLDNRSIRLNDESGLVVHHAGVGAALDSAFLRDLASAREITLEAVRGEGLLERLRDRLFGVFAAML